MILLWIFIIILWYSILGLGVFRLAKRWLGNDNYHYILFVFWPMLLVFEAADLMVEKY